MDHRYKKFLAVAETGSFSEAAKKLRVTQPAITIAIASLERAFGVKLYLRKKYSVELTEQGIIVARAAKKIDQEVGKMRTELGNNTTLKKYNIGIIDTIAHLAYKSPDNTIFLSNIEVMVDNSKRIINALLSESIDVGVITGQSSSIGKDLSILKLHNEEFVFVKTPHLISFEAVDSIEDWLAFNKDSSSYKHFLRLFKKEGLTVKPSFHSTSIELLKEMAIAGKGTALLPKHLVKESINNNTLAVVKTKPLFRPIWAVVNNKNKKIQTSEITGYIDNLLASNG
jgi:DNA-binding transcriptional LysR family regulator